MGRKKSKVWHQFDTTEARDAATGKVKKTSLCHHCNTSYAFPNATRMNEHLAYQCVPCPEDIQLRAKSELKNTKRKRTNSETSEIVDDCQACEVSESVKSACSSSTTNVNVNQIAVSVPHSHSVKSKQNLITSYLDKTSVEKKKKIDELIARAMYVSGSPLSMFDSLYWRAAVHELRPSYQLPSTYEFSTPLLNAEYSRVMSDVAVKLRAAVSLALMSDGWSNLRAEGIINFLVSTPAIIFIKNIVPGEERENAAFLARHLINVVDDTVVKYDVSEKKFFILITDNATNMKAAWIIFLERFPHMTVVACSAHSFNLLLGDIMKQPSLVDFFLRVKTVIKTIRKKSVVKATFRNKQRDHEISLKLPPKTRWCYVVICLESLLTNKAPLQETVICEQLKDIIPREVRNDALDNEGFWESVKSLHDFLQPLNTAIKRVEGDDATLSIVPEVSNDIRRQMQESMLATDLNITEKEHVQKAITERLYHCNLEVHFAANLLDPRFKGKKLDSFEIHAAMDYISKQCIHLNLDKAAIMADLASYRTCTGFYERDYLWESANSLKPAVWWGGLCASQPLEPLASRILSVPPSSAGSERDWSIQSSIHTKTKNRFRNDRVEKLKAVRQNLQYSTNALFPEKKKRKPNETETNNNEELNGAGNELVDLSSDFEFSDSDDSCTDDSDATDYDSEDQMPLAVLAN